MLNLVEESLPSTCKSTLLARIQSMVRCHPQSQLPQRKSLYPPKEEQEGPGVELSGSVCCMERGEACAAQAARGSSLRSSEQHGCNDKGCSENPTEGPGTCPGHWPGEAPSALLWPQVLCREKPAQVNLAALRWPLQQPKRQTPPARTAETSSLGVHGCTQHAGVCVVSRAEFSGGTKPFLEKSIQEPC